jgi:hypothetical protein
VPIDGRRWDTDERGHGVGSGNAFSPNVQRVRIDAFVPDGDLIRLHVTRPT